MAYVDRLFYALQTPLERYLKGGAAHELVHVFTAALAVGRQEVDFDAVAPERIP